MSVITFGAVNGNFSDDTKWVGGVKPTSADDVLLTATSANLTLDATATINSLNCTGYVGVLTHNSSVTITIDSQDASGNALLMVSGMTYTRQSSVGFTFTGAGTNKITTGGKVLNNITFNNSGDTFQLQDGLNMAGSLTNTAGTFDPNGQTVTMSGGIQTITPTAALSFYNLTRTGTAAKTDSLILAGNITVTNTFTLTGDSAINRLLVASNILGTARTITNTSVTETWSNVDFRDITMSEAVDASAITGGSGNCGGNTGITFTTADDWYWSSGTGNISDYSKWYTATGGGGTQMASTRVVLPQDTLYIDNGSDSGNFTITNDMPRVPAIDTSAYTDASVFTLLMSYANQQIYGSLDLTGVDAGNTFSATTYLYGLRGSHTLNLGSNAYVGNSGNQGFYFHAFGGAYTLLSNIGTGAHTYEGNYSFGVIYGTFDANDYNIKSRNNNSDNSNTRVVYMGSGTWLMTEVGTGYHYGWWWGGTNLTLYCETSTVQIYGSYFNGCAKVYNNINILTDANTPTFIDSNTFSTFTINAPKTVKFTSGTTQTVNSLVATGDASNHIHLEAVTAGTIATISDANGGTNENDYLDVLDIVATQANTFYYGANGSADAESTNWLASPTVASNALLFSMNF
jgi:hypothetical protein